MRHPVTALAVALVTAVVLTTADAEAGGGATPRRVRLTGAGSPRSASLLLRRYRRAGEPVRGKPLRFSGVGGRDVYNPTRPFVIGGRRVLAARVVFHRGRSLGSLERFAVGPWGMKDIRIAPLADGRLLVLTRPQGKRGGRGTIAYTVVASLDRLTPQALSRGRLIDGQFLGSEWGGANEIIPLGDDRFGVLGHIARSDARGDRHYYPVAFTIDARRGQVSALRTLVERRDLAGGLTGASKRSDLRDVLFSGGLDRHGDGTATLYVGAGDAEVHAIRITDPFL